MRFFVATEETREPRSWVPILTIWLLVIAAATMMLSRKAGLDTEAASTGLVAAYGFGENAGTTVNDASGDGNTGTISGATWTTAGKYGSALSFDGKSARVLINDSASLHLTNGITLEAWVSASSTPTNWQDVIYKENDVYFLEAGSSTSRHAPSIGGTFLSNGDEFLAGTTALKANTWTHLAATYDGATLILYVNGAAVATMAMADTLTTSTLPLQIGGDAAFGQYFKGTIDEVRIYNRALAAAEIQSDMNTPISGASDTQPPTAPTNLNASASSATAVSLTWMGSSDNVGVTGYLVERCAGAACDSFTQIGTAPTASYSDSTVRGATSYSYRVRATDAAGNLSSYSNVATVVTPAAPDTTPPSAPGSLAATVAGPSQINLSWTASTDNVGVTGYFVERCSGSGCTAFLQIATTTATTYSDTGLNPSTSYSYRVRATDAAGNLSAYSKVVTATTAAATDTTPPSAPSNLTATAASSTQINLAWTASTDNVGVTGYRVERCAGADCTTFAQIGAPTAVSYSDTGLAGSTAYSYRVRAADAAGNLSAYSNVASATTPATPQFKTIAYVQGNYATPQTDQTSVSVAYSAAQTAGNLNVVVAGWNDTVATVSSVSDTSGNVYVLAAGPTQTAGLLTQAIYYAKNIAGAAANNNAVTVAFNGAAGSADVRILEYSGLDYVTPLDAAAVATGNSTASTSASATTTNVTDLILGANMVYTGTKGAGTGFTKRLLTTPDGDIAEDKVVTTPGSYSATASLSPAGPWIMQMAAFKAALFGATPPPPINVNVTPVTATVPAGQTQTFTANVQNDPANAGVQWSLSGAGCNSASCGTLSNATTTGVTYTAPASVPTPATVTLQAASLTDGTRTATAAITVTPPVGVITVAVSPRRAATTLTQRQQFTALVSSDPRNLGVSWTVDGTPGGNANSGTISSSGLYTPGTQVGLHTVTALSLADGTTTGTASVAVTDLVGVFTHHNDVQRTGQNLQEYALSPATVNAANFGNLFSCSVTENGTVPGYVYAQPLYVANLMMSDGLTHNVLFVATESDFVYAFDADANPCQLLWTASMLDPTHGAAAGATTVPAADTGETGDLIPEIGITSTPVIDPATNTMYLVAKTKEPGPVYVQRLHALDITSGAEKFGGPATIVANGFDPLTQLQRPGLLLNNGTVYVAFGSHGDSNTYHGWVMGYDKTSLAQIFSWSATDLSANTMGGIWSGGSGPAADASGNVWVETGNGSFDGTINLADSVVKLSPTGTVADFFTPSYQDTLRANDIDLGSGGVTILPSTVGSAAHPNLAVATGKTGVLYLLDQTNLGQFSSSADNDVQEVVIQTLNTTKNTQGVFGKTVYWNANVYVAMIGDALRQYSIAQGALSSTANAVSTHTFAFPGSIPAISANGNGGGIVWAQEIGGYKPGAPAVLYAFDATNVATQLYVSANSGAGAAGNAVKFTVPTVANGKVYVGGQGQVTAFGLLP